MIDTIVVSGGSIEKEFAFTFIEKCREENENLILIAADKGLEFYLTCDLLPDVAVGDFDSLSEEGKMALTACAFEVITLKPEKDDSDTQSAVNLAIDRGARKIAVLGATGSRMDHMLANLGLMLLGKKRGAEITIVDNHNYMQLISSGRILKKAEQFGGFVSFFPIGGDVKGLSLNGFKYGLDHYHLRTEDSGLTVSNEIQEEQAVITYEEGNLLMIMSRD